MQAPSYGGLNPARTTERVVGCEDMLTDGQTGRQTSATGNGESNVSVHVQYM